jgi:excinuclease ABC subunit C
MARSLKSGKSLEECSAEGSKPCFDAHVGLGPGACCMKITPLAYAQSVKRIERFLSGSFSEFLDELTESRDEAATSLEFEKAARFNARIETIKSLTDKQNAVSVHNLCADIIGFYREEDITGVYVIMVREGRIVNRNEFVLNRGKDVPDEDLVHNFLLRYYDTTTSVPHEVVLSKLPEDSAIMQDWLSEKLASAHGGRVRFRAPQKGEKAKLLKMAKINAKHSLMRYKVRTNYDDKRINTALLQLESALALEEAPMRIECFDVSTIHGKHNVASMVVFSGGMPDKNQYRRFKVRLETDEANDFAMMSEVLGRRFSKERMADERFGKRPDLLIVDGGKPQLRAARQQLALLDLEKIAVCGLAKRDEELFVPWQEGPIVLPSGSSSLYLVKQIRDEAHRFAITFHREVRGKAMTSSILDDVVGLGPVRKRALMKAFKSFKNLKNATLEDIKGAEVLPDAVAEDLFALLRQYNKVDSDDRNHENEIGTHE